MVTDRDFKVIEKGLKGKAKSPTLILANKDGERLVLKFLEASQLSDFELEEEYTVKIVEGAQQKIA